MAHSSSTLITAASGEAANKFSQLVTPFENCPLVDVAFIGDFSSVNRSGLAHEKST
jgi:hypothetical protein